MKKIKVLIVDDSKYMRYVLGNMLGADPGMEVVGEARNGLDALEMIPRLNPDVVTMDFEMPRMDGLSALQAIIERHPLPVIMVSSHTREGGEITIRALELGAVDFVHKPEGRDLLTMDGVKEELLAKIKTAALVDVVRAVAQKPAGEAAVIHAPVAPGAAPELRKLIIIGSSTGGPKTLCNIMRRFPSNLPASIIIVQHMPEGFTASLSARLNTVSQLDVKEASAGAKILPGKALVAPGDYHLTISKDKTVRLSQEPRVNGVRPAIDVTMRSAAEVFGDRVVGVILTGMGRDGTEGGGAVRRAGGKMIAQSVDTCVVDGMPLSLIEAGQADKIAPIDKMASEIISLL